MTWTYRNDCYYKKGLTANGGRCGLCGDNFADATPRAHELGGRFGQGVIVKRFSI